PPRVLGKEITVEGVGTFRAVGVLEDPMTYRALFAAFDENRRTRTMTGSLLMFRNVYVGEDALATADLSGVAVALPDERRLAEGLLVSVVGGLAGLPLGYAAASLMRRIVDVPFRFEPRYAAVAVAVSAVLGLVSSVVPARRAAGLDPASVLSRRLT